jgi:mannose-6-phosphate isomerase-like protein (cupin superfamily)
MKDEAGIERPTVRRVITAQRDGKNVVAIDDQVLPIVIGRGPDSGQQLWQVWGSDGIPQLPNDATDRYANTLFAPPGGYRVQVCEFPAVGANIEPRGEWPELGTIIGRTDTNTVSDKLGDLTDSVHHYTNSVDIFVVLEGEIHVGMDDGVEVTVRAGEVLVQNGAAHSWRRGSVAGRVCMIAVGAKRADG